MDSPSGKEMGKKLFKQDTIEMAVKLHSSPGRSAWKYLPMTDKQKKILSPHIEQKDFVNIDRGAAMMMIESIFSEDKVCRATADLYSVEP